MRITLFKAILAAVFLTILPFTIMALSGQLNIGGDRGEHNGIDQLAAALSRLPAGTKVYDFWLGWELRFYLGDQPTVSVIFEPSPEAMARAVCQDRAKA